MPICPPKKGNESIRPTDRMHHNWRDQILLVAIAKIYDVSELGSQDLESEVGLKYSDWQTRTGILELANPD